MKLTRTLKRCISLAMIGVLFFAQMALAAYVCPVAAKPAVSTMADMPGCEGMGMSTVMEPAAMDANSPSLCHASCHSTEQSDQTSTVKLPVVTLSSLPFVVLPATPVALLGLATPARPQAAAASPPLSILYCCFRI